MTGFEDKPGNPDRAEQSRIPEHLLREYSAFAYYEVIKKIAHPSFKDGRVAPYILDMSATTGEGKRDSYVQTFQRIAINPPYRGENLKSPESKQLMSDISDLFREADKGVSEYLQHPVTAESPQAQALRQQQTHFVLFLLQKFSNLAVLQTSLDDSIDPESLEKDITLILNRILKV